MTARIVPRNGMAEPEPVLTPEEQSRWKISARPWWPWARRGFTLLFFSAVAAMLVRYGKSVDWNEVIESVRSMPVPALAAAFGLAATSHLLYSCFDLFGRRCTGHRLRTGKVMAINFISYAFNLTLGSIVGGVGFRYRLYSQAGLKNGVITGIVSTSMLTNWLGYMLLAGLLISFHPLALPPSWHMGNHGLQWAGLALVAISSGYLVACLRMGNRRWKVRGHELFLPPWRMAVLQLAISCLNWMMMAGVVYVLLQQRIAYTDVLTVLLVAAVAGVVAHVPAGLGVFEVVFLALLSHQVSDARLLGALLAYRAIYYVVPLAIASVLYVMLEANARRGRRFARADSTPTVRLQAGPRSAQGALF